MKKLYHSTARENRASIFQGGLQGRFARTGDETSFGEIYLSTKQPEPEEDVWEVEAEGLPLDLDNCQPEDLGEIWYCVVGQDIPPDRLKLLPS